jgi:hypothetical protein
MPKIKTKSQLRLYHPEKKRLRLLNLIIQNFNAFWGSYGGMTTFEDNYLETLRELEAFSTKEEIDTFEKALASHIAKMYIPSLQIVYESEVHKITEIEDYMLEHNFFVRLPFSLENHILFYILKRI